MHPWARMTVGGGTCHQFKATPQWTAPEAFGGRRYTAASDVFSMALVMWEMWALVPPFSGVRPFVDCSTALGRTCCALTAVCATMQVAPHEVPTVIISGRRPPIPAGMPRAVAALVQQCWRCVTQRTPCRGGPQFTDAAAGITSTVLRPPPVAPVAALLVRVAADLSLQR